ncbi:propionate CoA-transferase [Oscillospiraceae bacterium OttesenSCG-928-G22]|nr:propionate CoA-transferase [Oscillospiraceae bacterium OttesenSCG-928-G22]
MTKIMSLDDAVSLIRDGDTIWINAFLAISNPIDLTSALSRRVAAGNGPQNLTVYCSAGFGDWAEDSECEGFVRDGAVSRVVIGHYTSMPSTARKIMANEIEGYNLPLGVMSHMVRAAASRKTKLYSKVGLNLFVDPRYNQYGLNERSTAELVRRVTVEGEELLSYDVPKIDVALIKGSSADMRGNISFEDEAASLDALSAAQAARNNGGKVIVQVSRVTDRQQRPRNVIIPGMLVDAIVVCENQSQIVHVMGKNMSLSGDVYAHGKELEVWYELLQRNMITNAKGREPIHNVIGNRAFLELKEGQVANIGVGIPEVVGLVAVKRDYLSKICLTVESGATGGLPANGVAFGATIGAEMIVDMAQQFDFYDGGGLDICFIGALEIDKYGNVNGHDAKGKLSGIGGLANITQNSKNVVFCCTFSAKGLETEVVGEEIHIKQEGSVPKFVERVKSISFSAENARRNGQNILYVTERCVFDLGEKGLRLVEVADGIDLRRDILDRLPFEVEQAETLGKMPVCGELPAG